MLVGRESGKRENGDTCIFAIFDAYREICKCHRITRWLAHRLAPGQESEFHFVHEYERVIDKLLARYPLDEAMSRAAVGEYERTGLSELAVLR